MLVRRKSLVGWNQYAVIAGIIIAMLCSACATATKPAPVQSGAVRESTLTPGRRSSDILTGSEIRSQQGLGDGSAHDAIMRLRGEFLHLRVSEAGTVHVVTPAVFVNGAYQGSTEVLRSIATS